MRRCPERQFTWSMALSGVVFTLFLTCQASAIELAEAQKLFKTGKYTECIAACEQSAAVNPWEDGWHVLKIRSELMTGQYPQAMRTLQSALTRQEGSIALRLVGYDVLRANNRPQEADVLLVTIRSLAVRDPSRYSNAVNRVALGRALARAGADARQVLELFYDAAKKQDPNLVDTYIASAELALEKEDYAVAAEAYTEAAKRAPDDPDVHYGLALSYQDNSERATAALAKALELNPKHIDSLLFQADNLIDQEAYAQAEELIKQVLEINPRQHRALSYRAVMAHLIGDREREQALRKEALGIWVTNPDVDHIIGQKLSAKYRFSEGEASQRQALRFVPNYRKAKIQLSQDLLRLGKEEEGWRLAAEVFKEDQYNVVAFNLVTLNDNMKKFIVLENDHFAVRMDPREAQIYGQRVLKLLADARQTLSTKYSVDLPNKTYVEIFPQQKDFAIRTFGLPGGAGFLGVCFGNVVTMNSPASRGANPVNWEAVLWHEYCHVMTLQMTKNKMPRWLSEGISVYEERQKNGSWGQMMNPQYREMVLTDKSTPVSKLSGAFLKPPTPMHLQFAYYESSMVVEYIVGRFGAPALRQVLIDLGSDVPINKALASNTEPIDKLDENFAVWFKKQAENLAPNADMKRPELMLDAGASEMAAWNKENPNNFWGLLGEGRALVAERKWEQAKAPLSKAIELYPTCGVAGGPYLLLAAAHRELKETDAERTMLEKHVALTGDAIEPRLRLLEIAAEKKDAKAMKLMADQVLAINPLIPVPHRYMLQAADSLGERSVSIEERRTLLLMDPLDRADHHYQLARLLVEEQQLPEARKQVVQALEQAPRFRAAHKLFLEIVERIGPTVPATEAAPTTTPSSSAVPEGVIPQ